ncbi:hypothetical protein Mal64_29290 [Pseudobythopirellula maris]|uniref:Uncharacterized protein n=1 Tax=Pseudobythopirellula maris TaxID=2527991 RepID=A0A5C5ZJM0_9BACT|nr:hypothetical protein [Pseudobythopirellula maris]TWT87390.1 hypothetical protein Mal64_29290 [Pseudobythopirellula maris]
MNAALISLTPLLARFSIFLPLSTPSKIAVLIVFLVMLGVVGWLVWPRGPKEE